MCEGVAWMRPPVKIGRLECLIFMEVRKSLRFWMSGSPFSSVSFLGSFFLELLEMGLVLLMGYK